MLCVKCVLHVQLCEKVTFAKCGRKSSIVGSGWFSLSTASFARRISMHIRTSLLFGTGTTGEIHFDGSFTFSIIPSFNSSSIFLSTASSSATGTHRYGCMTGFTSSLIGISTTNPLILLISPFCSTWFTHSQILMTPSGSQSYIQWALCHSLWPQWNWLYGRCTFFRFWRQKNRSSLEDGLYTLWTTDQHVWFG